MNRFLCALCLLLAACSAPSDKGNPRIVIRTEEGDIELELFAKQAPKTVAAFLGYVQENHYRNSRFYRVLTIENQPSDAFKAELIQGGLWKTNYELTQSLPGIPHESTQQTGIRHKKGVISLARNEPGTATTEFFICVDDEPGFDYGGRNNADGQGYAAFGRVVRGMNVVYKIHNRRERDQAFTPPVVIYDIDRK